MHNKSCIDGCNELHDLQDLIRNKLIPLVSLIRRLRIIDIRRAAIYTQQLDPIIKEVEHILVQFEYKYCLNGGKTNAERN